MKGYTKELVRFHAEYMQRAHPAVNVKVYHLPDPSEVQQMWPDVDDETAEHALQLAFENAQESFWDTFTDTETLNEYFPGYGVKVFCEGRSGGWLVVHGLPEWENWDAVLLGRWARFEQAVKEEVEYLTSKESLIENIKANGYHEL